MHVFLHDLRFAGRTLIRERVLGFIVISLLALGIAGTTAIFSVYNGLFLKPLPFPEPERLVDIDETAPKWNLERVSVAYIDFSAWRRDNNSFESMAAWDGQSFNLSGLGSARRVEGVRATHELTTVLGVRPVIGRAFLPEEARPGGEKVVLLGHGLWQRQFGGDRDILGERLLLDSEPYTIVGVLPPEAAFPENAEVWIPLTDNPEGGGSWYLKAVGRLKAGVSLEQARGDLIRVHKGLIETRKVNEITSPVVQSLRDRYLGDYHTVATVLLGAVGVVLLIACVNVAGLMLARATARSKEMGIRAAIGATRPRIVRLLLTESLLLAAAGGLAGVIVGYGFLRALTAALPEGLPAWVRFEVDWRILAFGTLASGASAILFGLAPAIEACRIDVQKTLHEASGRSTVSAARSASLKLLVAGEVALAVVLLVAAGLLLQAYRQVVRVDPGFRAEHVLTYRVSLPGATYEDSDKRLRFFQGLAERQRALPGVEAVGAGTSPPLGSHTGYFLEVEGAAPLGPDEQDPVILQRAILPGYMEALGIELARGRGFTEDDGRTEGTLSVIVNETFARRFWPNDNPIGKRVRHRGGKGPWMSVVGVNRDVMHYGLDREMRPGVHVPYRQAPSESLTYVVKTSVDPNSLVAQVRGLLIDMDPDLPMFQVTTMSAKVDESLAMRRTYTGLFVAFASIALVMALAGIYGLVSYVVSRRTHEIGIRMALGAQQSQVLGHVMADGMKLVFAGVALGVVAAFASAHLLETMLFGVAAHDAATYLLVVAILLTVALLANLLPARRAAAVNPTDALRSE